MDPEVKPVESVEVTPAEVTETAETASHDLAPEQTGPEMNLDMSTEQPGSLSKLPPAEESGEVAWQEARDQVSWLLNVLPERLGEVYQEYKKPITTAGIALAAIPFVVLTVALLRMINAIPLFAPTFELVGFGYSAWFVYRYLLFAERRQELSQEYQTLKERILGQKD